MIKSILKCLLTLIIGLISPILLIKIVQVCMLMFFGFIIPSDITISLSAAFILSGLIISIFIMGENDFYTN